MFNAALSRSNELKQWDCRLMFNESPPTEDPKVIDLLDFVEPISPTLFWVAIVMLLLTHPIAYTASPPIAIKGLTLNRTCSATYARRPIIPPTSLFLVILRNECLVNLSLWHVPFIIFLVPKIHHCRVILCTRKISKSNAFAETEKLRIEAQLANPCLGSRIDQDQETIH